MIPYSGDGETEQSQSEGSGYLRTLFLTELLTRHLPRMPWYLLELQGALEDRSTDLEKVCTALQRSPAICESFVKLACIAQKARPIRIALDHLVVMLGKQRSWETSVAAFFLTEVGRPWTNAGMKKVAAIAIAQATQALAEAEMTDAEEPGDAYTRALLSVVGLVPLVDAAAATDMAPEWVDITPEALQKQQERFGTDYVELTRWIKLMWQVLETPEKTSSYGRIHTLYGQTNHESRVTIAPIR